MNSNIKKCARCEKKVYPIEEIQCLDKCWHKGCLRCTTCGLTLNMNNVQSYDRLPYCQAHNPRPKPTTIVDNAEMQRIRSLNQIFHTIKSNQNSIKSSTEIQTNTKESSINQSNQINLLEISSDRNDLQSDLVENSSTSQSNENDLHSNFHQRLDDDRENQANSNCIDPPLKMMTVQAIYAYQSTDIDDICFDEGDIINDCQYVDDGWLFGRHSITGHLGLVPSNYVQILN